MAKDEMGECRARTWEEVEDLLADVHRREEGLRLSVEGLMIEDSSPLRQLLKLLKGLARSEGATGDAIEIFPPLVEDGWALTAAIEKGEVEGAFVAAQRRERQLRSAQEMVDALRQLPWVVSEADVEEWLDHRLDGWDSLPLRDCCPALQVGAYVFSRRYGTSEGKETRAALLGYVVDRRTK